MQFPLRYADVRLGPRDVILEKTPFPSRRACAVTALAISMFSASAQQRLPLKIQPQDQGIKLQTSEDGKITLLPSGGMHPISYRTAPDMSRAVRGWQPLPSPANPEWLTDGSLVLSSTNVSRFFAAAFPDFSKFNGFLRIPINVVSEDLTTGVVVLHPTQLGPNSGYAFEQEIGPHCDNSALASYFPSALNTDGTQNRWNGLTGAQASDYKQLLNGIRIMKELVPTLKKIKLAAYSDGVGTAIGFAQLYPEEVHGLLLIAGFNNKLTAKYALERNHGQPVRLKPPIPLVAIVSRYDNEFIPEIVAACNWFAAANGFTGTTVTNAIKRDYNAKVAGEDATVISYGEHVRLVVSDARTHEDSTYESTNGFRVLYGNFLKRGDMPGTEN